MFAILISEKGGAERRETFDQLVVTIGRVQDNDLTLSKGNVSKRHCRLECTDGRFVVTDEDSTNGTYVNRRRITQPTTVRDGDRIYVGDFVLRLERDAEEATSAHSPEADAPEANFSTAGQADVRVTIAPTEGPAFTPSLPRHAPAPGSLVQSDAKVLPPQTAAPHQVNGDAPVDGDAEVEVSTTAGGVEHVPPIHTAGPQSASTSVRAAARSLIEEVFRRVEPRVLERALDREASERLERILVEQATQLAALGHALASDQADHAVQLARAEILGLGPLEPLLDDVSVSEIVVTGASDLSFVREGLVHEGLPFCHPRAVEWTLGRLCRQASVETDEGPLVRTVLPRTGFELHAVRDVACKTGALLRLKRWRAGNVQLDDLVQVGTLSRAMATFLRHCVMARANLLIVGRRDSGSDDLLDALGALVAHERVSWLVWNSVCQGPPQGTDFSLVSVTSEVNATELLAVLSGMGHRVVAPYPPVSFGRGLFAAAACLDGLVVLHEARTVEAGLTQLSHQMASPELRAEDVRNAVGQAFDVVVEVVRLGDGRSRVMRIAEPNLQSNESDDNHGDIFKFVVERTATGGSIEGSFTAPARATTLLKSLRARGIAVEESLFLRPASE